MAGRIITVAQQKGGAGKTTLAAHLAVAWLDAGHRVAVIDIDPQGSLTRWFQARLDSTGGDPGLLHAQITGWRTQREVERLAREHDVVVIDSPPHAETEARIAVRSARLVVVPVQPSPMDLWATQSTLDLCHQEKVPLMVVLNRVPPRARLADELVEKIKELADPPYVTIALTQLGNRVGYAGAMMTGRTVSETQRRTRAAEEMAELAAEVYRRAG